MVHASCWQAKEHELPSARGAGLVRESWPDRSEGLLPRGREDSSLAAVAVKSAGKEVEEVSLEFERQWLSPAACRGYESSTVLGLRGRLILCEH